MDPAYIPNKVNVGSETDWKVVPSSYINSGYVPTWKISENGGTTFTADPSNSTVLGKIFTTVGQKIVGVYLASTTNSLASGDCQTMASTTIVWQGGGVKEI